MPKRNLSETIKRRAEQAETGAAVVADDAADLAYRSLFGGAAESPRIAVCTQDIALDKLRAFHTANIGFKAYNEQNLRALADDIATNGLLEHIKMRPECGAADTYEIMSGHNRVQACRLLGKTHIRADVMSVDDDRAIVIATVTNLQRRQGLLPSERGWAYRALLEAQKRQGKRTDLEVGTSVEIQQKWDVRSEIARFFDVKAHDVQRDIRLTHLITPLLDAVDERRLNLMCGVQISYYDHETQRLFYERLQAAQWKLTTAVMDSIKRACPPPSIPADELRRVWSQATDTCARAAQKSGKIVLDRKRFEPYLAKIQDENKIEELFLEFLRTHLV